MDYFVPIRSVRTIQVAVDYFLPITVTMKITIYLESAEDPSSSYFIQRLDVSNRKRHHLRIQSKDQEWVFQCQNGWGSIIRVINSNYKETSQKH